MKTLTKIKQRQSHYEAVCRRCRHRWEEIHDTRITNGIGQLTMCPRCFARWPNGDLFSDF